MIQPGKATLPRDVAGSRAELRYGAALRHCLCSAEQARVSAERGQVVAAAQGPSRKQSQSAWNVKVVQGCLMQMLVGSEETELHLWMEAALTAKHGSNKADGSRKWLGSAERTLSERRRRPPRGPRRRVRKCGAEERPP